MNNQTPFVIYEILGEGQQPPVYYPTMEKAKQASIDWLKSIQLQDKKGKAFLYNEYISEIGDVY